MHVNFTSSKDTGETRTIYVWSNTKKLGLVMKQMILLRTFLNFFLNNYQQEEIILRKGSDFVFESVDLLSYSFHK